jgi:hypothetical protein
VQGNRYQNRCVPASEAVDPLSPLPRPQRAGRRHIAGRSEHRAGAHSGMVGIGSPGPSTLLGPGSGWAASRAGLEQADRSVAVRVRWVPAVRRSGERHRTVLRAQGLHPGHRSFPRTAVVASPRVSERRHDGDQDEASWPLLKRGSSSWSVGDGSGSGPAPRRAAAARGSSRRPPRLPPTPIGSIRCQQATSSCS